MFENYIDVRNWLENFIPLVYGKEELGLKRIKNLLELLGNPERKFKSIHVAGTSGKGSIAFYICKMLQLSVLSSQLSDESQSVSQLSGKPKTGIPKSENRKQRTDNWKIGLHISPHLVDIRERMQVFHSSRHPELARLVFDLPKRVSGSKLPDHDPASKNLHETGSSLMSSGRFLKLFEQVRPVVEKIQKGRPGLTPSYFEILVAATFKYFAEEKVDWAVVEVGLGGRLDATNVLVPQVSVITNIGLDHTEILGKTIEKIAAEKAGIIKPGVPLVTGAKGAALRVIERVAREKKAPLYSSSETRSFHKNYDNSIGKFSLRSNSNLELAKRVVEVVLGRKVDISFNDLGGLPGRFEEIEQGVILDGAHNPDKIQALIEFMKRHSRPNREEKFFSEKSDPRFPSRGGSSFGWREDDGISDGVVLVLAFKKGKNWKQMIDLMVKNLPVQTVIATQYQAVTDTGKGSAVDPKEICDYVTKVHNAQCKVISNSQEAVFEALRLCSGSSTSQSTVNRQLSTVLVTGSLYLVGEVRTMWKLPSFA